MILKIFVYFLLLTLFFITVSLFKNIFKVNVWYFGKYFKQEPDIDLKPRL